MQERAARTVALMSARATVTRLEKELTPPTGHRQQWSMAALLKGSGREPFRSGRHYTDVQDEQDVHVSPTYSHARNSTTSPKTFSE